MPVATRTFRVFVGSTFEDLKAERDALQREVFPRLRKLCEENNARDDSRFRAIDLLWGVRDEAALDQQTMQICLREIERCQQTGIKPKFIVLLGGGTAGIDQVCARVGVALGKAPYSGSPLSCIPIVVMQKPSQGPNWTENAGNADEAEIVQLVYYL